MLMQAGFEALDTLLEVSHLVTHAVQIGLHRRWGLLPVLRRKGIWPGWRGGRIQSFQGVSNPKATGVKVVWSCYSRDSKASPEKNARGE